jgi:hypothetical protein
MGDVAKMSSPKPDLRDWNPMNPRFAHLLACLYPHGSCQGQAWTERLPFTLIGGHSR